MNEKIAKELTKSQPKVQSKKCRLSRIEINRIQEKIIKLGIFKNNIT